MVIRGKGAQPTDARFRVQALAWLLLGSTAPLLAGCSSVPSSINPVSWWHSMQGGEIAKERPPPPGATDAFPNLASVPAKPEAPDRKALETITQGLVADRAHAEYLSAATPLTDPSSPAASPGLFGQGTLPPPPPAGVGGTAAAGGTASAGGPAATGGPATAGGPGGPAPAPGVASASLPAATAPPAPSAPAAPPTPAPRRPVASAPLAPLEPSGPSVQEATAGAPPAAAPSVAPPPVSSAPVAPPSVAAPPPVAPPSVAQSGPVPGATAPPRTAASGAPPRNAATAAVPGAPAPNPNVPLAPPGAAALPQIASAPPPPIPTSPPAPPRMSGPGATGVVVASIPTPPAAAPQSATALTVEFVPGSAALPPGATDMLKGVAAKRGQAVIAVTGYGDAASSDPAAQTVALSLGLSRAQAVANVLTGDGVPAAAVRVGAEAGGRGASVRLVQ